MGDEGVGRKGRGGEKKIVCPCTGTYSDDVAENVCNLNLILLIITLPPSAPLRCA